MWRRSLASSCLSKNRACRTNLRMGTCSELLQARINSKQASLGFCALRFGTSTGAGPNFSSQQTQFSLFSSDNLRSPSLLEKLSSPLPSDKLKSPFLSTLDDRDQDAVFVAHALNCSQTFGSQLAIDCTANVASDKRKTGRLVLVT